MQDMFGVQVQVTYKGKRAFNTVLGGLVSIFISLGLVVYFGTELHQQYTSPKFRKYPTRNDYSGRTSQINPQNGNTLAMALYTDIYNFASLDDPVHQAARIMYQITEIDSETYYYPEAVLCTDLYADQIRNENSLSQTFEGRFKKMFAE